MLALLLATGCHTTQRRDMAAPTGTRTVFATPIESVGFVNDSDHYVALVHRPVPRANAMERVARDWVNASYADEYLEALTGIREADSLIVASAASVAVISGVVGYGHGALQWLTHRDQADSYVVLNHVERQVALDRSIRAGMLADMQRLFGPVTALKTWELRKLRRQDREGIPLETPRTMAILNRGAQRASARSDAIDTVVTIEFVTAGMVGHFGINPRKHLEVDAVVKVERLGRDESAHEFRARYRGETRRFSSWARDDGALFREECLRATGEIVRQARERLRPYADPEQQPGAVMALAGTP